MGITLSAAFMRQLKKKGSNTPNVLIELDLDAGTDIFSYYPATAGGGGSVPVGAKPIIQNVTSTQSTLNTRSGWSSRGEISFDIVGRENFRFLIQNNYLKNRRVVKKEGFIGDGFLYAEYAETFFGKVVDWKRNGDKLTVFVADDSIDTTIKIPTVNASKTQTLDFTGSGAGMNPVDIMLDILLVHLGISTSYVDSAQFIAERDAWIAYLKFSRVLTDARDAKDFLNELQIDSNSFIVHDGQKISFKVFAPTLPTQSVESWSDAVTVIKNSLICDSGYRNEFFNAVVVYYDYKETGSKGEDEYESVELLGDADSQGSAQWDETKTKYIFSKWIRSFTFTPPVSSPMPGVVMYHVSNLNAAGEGELFFTFDAVDGNHTLKWKPPGGQSVFGTPVTIAKDGKYQIVGDHPDKTVRVVVTYDDLDTVNNSDIFTITALSGSQYARTIGNKTLNRFRNPSSSVEFEIDLNAVGYDDGGGYTYVSTAEFKNLTTDDAFEFGDSTWVDEGIMVTSVRPDFLRSRLKIKAIETKQYRRTCFICPNGFPDYTSATDAQKRYGFVGRAVDNKVGVGTEDGYYSW